MAEEMTLEENERRFNAALERLQWMVDAGSGVPDETLAEFLTAAHDYRKDLRYKAQLAI